MFGNPKIKFTKSSLQKEKKMKCETKDCHASKDCTIRELLKKAPDNCSYFRTQTQIDKKLEQQKSLANEKPKRKKKDN